jgi:hypothetical protein
VKEIFDMLIDQCPQLEDLHLINQGPLHITPLAQRGCWPSLRNLTLGGMGDTATITVTNANLSEFINAQPHLERLYIHCSHNTNLPVDELPELLALHIRSGATFNKNRRFPVSKRLEYLAADFGRDYEGYLHLLRLRPPIRALVIAPPKRVKVREFLSTFVEFIPNLEKLHWNDTINHSNVCGYMPFSHRRR